MFKIRKNKEKVINMDNETKIEENVIAKEVNEPVEIKPSLEPFTAPLTASVSPIVSTVEPQIKEVIVEKELDVNSDAFKNAVQTGVNAKVEIITEELKKSTLNLQEEIRTQIKRESQINLLGKDLDITVEQKAMFLRMIDINNDTIEVINASFVDYVKVHNLMPTLQETKEVGFVEIPEQVNPTIPATIIEDGVAKTNPEYFANRAGENTSKALNKLLD